MGKGWVTPSVSNGFKLIISMWKRIKEGKYIWVRWGQLGLVGVKLVQVKWGQEGPNGSSWDRLVVKWVLVGYVVRGLVFWGVNGW